MQRFVLFMIQAYRNTGGGKRWFGIDCNFTPSCSEYTLHAVRLYGLSAGIKLGLKRIKCCGKRDSFCKCIDPVQEL